MNLNENFIQEINKLLAASEATAMLQAIESGEPVTSVRFNSNKGFLPPASLKPVPWCEMGAYLSERPQFTFDPHFHAGSYYVQDASSMFIYHVIKSLIKQPVKYLDMCAAPGGKTTAALQALPEGSLTVANEIVPQRAQILRENIIKWGVDTCVVTNDSPKTLGGLKNVFDVIAADVPCSGEGMFRKDEGAVSQWSPQLVAQCAARQREILNDIWPALKPGGILIYSTCTYNRLENEDIVDYVINSLEASVIAVPTLDCWNIGHAIGLDSPCYRFMPHLTRGEGLFMCLLRKEACNNLTHSPTPYRIKQRKPVKKSTIIPAQAQEWIGDNYELYEENGIIRATRRGVEETLKAYGDNLHVIKDFGTEIGVVKGKNLIPSHQLAMSTQLIDEKFTKCEVDYNTAIAYLRGESIQIESNRGFVLITHQGAILGFANNLGNRANNLYPKSWRIMSTHLPSVPPSII